MNRSKNADFAERLSTAAESHQSRWRGAVRQPHKGGRSHNGTVQVIGRHTVIAARLPSGLCRKLCAAKLCIVALSMKAAN